MRSEDNEDNEVIDLLRAAIFVLEKKRSIIQKDYHTIIGRFLGFPDCCVQYFINGIDDNYVSEDFVGTGLVPCYECSGKNKEDLIREINAKRICVSKFPHTDGKFYSAMKDSNLWTTEEKEIVREFQNISNQISKIGGVIFSIKNVDHMQ